MKCLFKYIMLLFLFISHVEREGIQMTRVKEIIKIDGIEVKICDSMHPLKDSLNVSMEMRLLNMIFWNV